MHKIRALILSGGSGKRLWPISTAKYPKQFVELFGATLLDRTISNLKEHSIFSDINVVGNQMHSLHFDKYLNKIDKLILESEAPGTASSIYAALKFGDYRDDDYVIILPSDHILDYSALVSSINIDLDEILKSNIICFGLVPHYPSTEYGYIKSSEICSGPSDVLLFCEKPTLDKAYEYINSKSFFWNSGIILARVDILLNEYEKYFQFCSLLNNSFVTKVNNKIYIKYENGYTNTSIDYAILEKSNKIKVIQLNDESWSDLGSHYALSRYINKNTDHDNNILVGSNVKIESVKNCIIINMTSTNVAIVGSENSTIIITSNGTLVMKNGLDSKLSGLNFEYEDTLRPWGSYDVIYSSEAIKIKFLYIKPYSSISLQKHNFRSEHWVVIDGVASVTNGKDNFLLYKGESTYIQKNTIHRLENNSSEDLKVLEVQFGNYLGEDDIVRFDDHYGRK